jgi:dTDP-glucose pyrophosphorylase
MNSKDQHWRKAILSSKVTLGEAIKNLNDVSLKIILVADENDQLKGIVSDGDIRRGLLKGLTLDSPIFNVMKTSEIVVPPGMGIELVIQVMRLNKIYQIPVVNEKGQLVGLQLLDEIIAPPKHQNIMVIMAGGMGTRMRPFTENCPKPMLQVSGKPMLEHIIARAKLEGFCNFVISIYSLGHVIEDYFGDGKRLGVSIEYLREKFPLGTAGALSLLHPAPPCPIIITNGDVMTDIRFGELLDFHLRHEASATMAVRAHEWQHPFGVVQTQGIDIIGFEEKPIIRDHINAGVYVLDPMSLTSLSLDTYCDMPTLFERLRENNKRIIAYPMHEPWLDVGKPDDLIKINSKI